MKAKQRNALPDNMFGLSAARKYPMENASHAADAKGRATQAVNAGRMAPSTAKKIDAKANKVIKRGKC